MLHWSSFLIWWKELIHRVLQCVCVCVCICLYVHVCLPLPLPLCLPPIYLYIDYLTCANKMKHWERCTITVAPSSGCFETRLLFNFYFISLESGVKIFHLCPQWPAVLNPRLCYVSSARFLSSFYPANLLLWCILHPRGPCFLTAFSLVFGNLASGLLTVHTNNRSHLWSSGIFLAVIHLEISS